MPLSLVPGPDESLDPLSRTLMILQRRRGHRAGSDDVVLAWTALHACPDATAVLDLGSGQATVAMLLASRLPSARVLSLEAQAVSHQLACRNVALNRLGDRVLPVHGDLRAAEALGVGGGFDLITGAPPFMPLGTGVLPQDPQRAAGRFELRGGVEDYLACAVPRLAPGGRAVILMDGLSAARTRAAIARVGLRVEQLVEVGPRPGRPPTYQAFVAGSPDVVEGEARTRLSMRGVSGDAWTSSWVAVRSALDLP
jgi:tRNA1(Val) A37 N6-methylase TrmN6